MKVSLSPQQRIGLENALSQQGGVQLRLLMAYFKILEVVKVSKEYRATYLRMLPGSIDRAEWNLDALATAPPFDVEFDTEQVDALLNLTHPELGWRGFQTVDVPWIMALRSSLQKT